MNKEYFPCNVLPIIRIGDRLEVLFSCIGSALFSYDQEYDLLKFLPRIVGDERPLIGDTGWFLCLVKKNEDSECPEKWEQYMSTLSSSSEGCYEAYEGYDYAEDDEDYHYYSVEEVRHYIRMALENIAIKRPEQAEEVKEFIKRYAL